MFRLEMLPACEGDCLIISWGNAAAPYRMLIDGGRKPTASRVLDYARNHDFQKGMFELFVVTHIDRDHIEGAVSLLRDDRFPPLVKQIWFNDRGDLEYAEPEPGFETFGALDGERLTGLIAERKIPRNLGFAPGPVAVRETPLPSVTLSGGLVLTLLSPDPAQLADLAKPWDDTVAEAPEGWEEYGEEEIDIALLAKSKFKADTSKPNGSSIAMVAEYEGKRLLLTGDAHVDRLTASLEIYRSERADFEGFDLVKASHHGSRANVSLPLVEQLACKTWAISTNGTQFKHPDREAVARIIAASPSPTRVHFNYDTQFTRIWKSAVGGHHDFEALYGSDGYCAVDID